MLNITAKMQVVIEEITLDVREYLRTLYNQPNDALTRMEVTDMIESYLAELEDIQTFAVICDESNNTDDVIRSGQLNAVIHFVVEGASFEGKFNVGPGTGQYVDVIHDFYLCVKHKPVLPKDKIVFDPLFIARDIPATEQEIEVLHGLDLEAEITKAVELLAMPEMPAGLASSLLV